MIVSMIAAMTPDRAIGGSDGGIPWNLPRDRTHFRRYTAGKWMLVGRRTYEEMAGWFGDRTALVLTKRKEFQPEAGHRVVGSIAEGIEFARANGCGELVVSGGASVYEAALPFADRLILTTIETKIAGGAFFPECRDPAEWRLVHRETWPRDEENSHAAVLRILDRRR